MPDETAVAPNTETVAVKTDATPKKTRAPRQPKLATPAVVKAEPVKRQKRVAKAAEAPGKTTASAKTPKASKPGEAAVKTSTTPVPASDEFSDLLKLEEENKQLRKTLAEKLRSENADLRKRLGMV